MEGRIFPFNILVTIVLVIQYVGYLFPAPAVHEICVAVLLLIARLLAKRRMFSQKLAMKTENRRPLAHMEGDEEEQSESETLPLRMGVRLKKAQASDSNHLMLEKKKRGCLDPSESMRKFWCSFPDLAKKRTDDHSFPERDGSLYNKVHREADFRQTVTVVPVTFISHFMSPDQMQLQREGVRLSTFKDFPQNVPVSALRLAQAGFYFVGERDRVRCFCCGATREDWRFGDRPTAVHKRISPDCAFVKGTDTTSIPLPLPVTSRADFTADDGSSNTASDEVVDNLGPDTQRGSALAASGEPLTRAGSFDDGRHSGAPINGQISSMDRGAPRQLPMPSSRLGLGGAVYPMYSQRNVRQRSFNTWTSLPSLPSVDELVTMGFYYTGYADCVRCFFCGVGLRSWEAGAIPAEVHARFRPTCQYLRLVKGDNFVDAVVTAFGNVSNNAQPLAHGVQVAANDGGLCLRPSISVITQCDEDLEDHQHDRGSNRRRRH